MTTDLTAHWRTLFENKYLGAWNLYVKGRYTTVTVTIDRAVMEQTTMEGGRKAMSLLLYFVGKRTPLIVTKKMGKVIASMHGASPAGWAGKAITLYVEQGFPTRDGPADVLRVKNEKAGSDLKRRLRASPPPEDDEAPAAPPEIERFDDEGGNDGRVG